MDRRRLIIANGVTVGDTSGPINTSNYMTILALEDGLTASLSNNACQYCIDGDGNWIDLPSGTTTQSINQGQTLSFKGNLTPKSYSGIGTFTISKKCNLLGNCMSLLFSDNAVNNNSLFGKNYAFYNLFKSCTTIMQVSESFLPATTLADSCYYEMFRGCTSLTTAPELPATTLTSNCYYYMFRGCTSLTTAPELPATTLANYCYYYMFYGCISLTTAAPELPATTLAISCYYGMFYDCTSLTTAPSILPATTLASSCYNGMFYGCSKLTTAPELPATTLASDCYNGMFYGCSSLTTAPELPATTLANYCYRDMFYGCIRLTTAPELPATTLANYCYYGMFYDCIRLTTAPELPATTLANYCYRNMFSRCSKLTTAPELPATTLANYCYYGMFQGCSSLTAAPELPATTLASSCYNGMFYDCSGLTSAPELPVTTLASSCYSYMFYGCSSLTVAPELPATTLASSCYSYMFYGCRNLNYIKMLATDISATSCLYNWVYNVSSTGTFVKNPAMTSLPTGDSGIPNGWTVKDNYQPISYYNLQITADDVSGNQTNTTIYWTCMSDGIVPDSNEPMTGIQLSGTSISDEFPQNTSETNTVERAITFEYQGLTATTTITQGVWKNQSYTIDLNSNWEQSTSISNPDSSLYDGVYQSYSNKGVNNSEAKMYIDIEGYTNFKLYIRSYAESSYDYVMVSQLDQDINSGTSYSNTTLVKAHTRDKQTFGTAISNYTLVEFTGIDEGEHRITIIYRKDSSSDRGDDRGYILIPKGQ